MGELRAKLMAAMTRRAKEACSQVPFLSYCSGPWPPPPQYARMSSGLVRQVVERCHPHLSHERRSSHAGTQQQQGRKYRSMRAFVCTQACNTGSAGSHKPAIASVLGTPDGPTCYLSPPGDWQTLPDSVAPNHSRLDASSKGACLLEERKYIGLSIVVGISVLLLCGCSQLIWYSSTKCKSLRPDASPTEPSWVPSPSTGKAILSPALCCSATSQPHFTCRGSRNRPGKAEGCHRSRIGDGSLAQSAK